MNRELVALAMHNLMQAYQSCTHHQHMLLEALADGAEPEEIPQAIVDIFADFAERCNGYGTPYFTEQDITDLIERYHAALK